MSAEGNSKYIHGSEPSEQDRLSRLNVLLNERCLHELRLQGTEHILDVGSGLGQFSRLMARQGCKVTAIERDTAQIAAARQLAEAANEGNLVDFRNGDALDLPLQAHEWGHYDIAHTRFLLEHVPHPARVIRQMLQALRPGGRIILADDDHSTFVVTPEPPGFSEIWQAYMRSYDRLGNDPYIGRRLVSLLHQAGGKPVYNTLVFFGGCAGDPLFSVVADNLIGILEGARHLILQEGLLSVILFDKAIAGLHEWKTWPDAALWYGMYWAEGVKE